MKNKKYTSLRRKSYVLLPWIISEGIIIVVFILVLIASRPINWNNTHADNICVTQIHCIPQFDNRVFIYSNSDEFYFPNLSLSSHYSNTELSQMIRAGDEISIIYEERWSILGNNKCIIDARTETDVYRSPDEYNNSKKGVVYILIAFFCFTELMLAGLFFLACRLSNNLRNLFKCRRKH